MRDCPYCANAHFNVVTPDRPRHPQHTTVVCTNCAQYAVRHSNGTVFPLVAPSDRNSDTLPRR